MNPSEVRTHLAHEIGKIPTVQYVGVDFSTGNLTLTVNRMKEEMAKTSKILNEMGDVVRSATGGLYRANDLVFSKLHQMEAPGQRKPLPYQERKKRNARRRIQKESRRRNR